MMASAIRSALVSGTRTIATGSNLISRTLTPKSLPVSPFNSSTRTVPRAASRILGALGTVESMVPLHSAIASARLRSSIAVDSTCWSWLSQGVDRAPTRPALCFAYWTLDFLGDKDFNHIAWRFLCY